METQINIQGMGSCDLQVILN
ncbi:unnamed protein product [Phytomonas sp. Hart1]|nr:unnamed protein product [Phytomonas sp. Hart1]|eukprot:CCW65933.1 unnamed protein product [Phytomonas sp. isolate Hart1]